LGFLFLTQGTSEHTKAAVLEMDDTAVIARKHCLEFQFADFLDLLVWFNYMNRGPFKFYFVLSFVFLYSQAVHPTECVDMMHRFVLGPKIRSSNYFSPIYSLSFIFFNFFLGGGVLFGVWFKQLRLQIDTFWCLLFDEGTKEEVKGYQRISCSKEKGIYAISLLVYLLKRCCL
jgi:hypothetical protein